MRKLMKYLLSFSILMFLGIYVTTNYDTLKPVFEELLDTTLTVAKNKTDDLQKIIANGYLVKEDEAASLEDSNITGSRYSFNKIYYPYYEMLTINEKTLYRQVFANVNSMNKTFVPVISVSKEEVARTVEAVYNDHPELFWLNTIYSYKYKANGSIVQIILEFNDTANNIEQAKEVFNERANKIIKKASTLNSDYEKEKYVHDTIIQYANYSLDAPLSQSAYSALVYGETVCAGYARAFQYIMTNLEIPTFYVTGYSNGEHAWNIVNLSDGCYNVDLTWNDTNPISYTYFNLTDKEISKTHSRKGLSELLFSCNATTNKKRDSSSKNSQYKNIIIPED